MVVDKIFSSIKQSLDVSTGQLSFEKFAEIVTSL